MHTPSNPTNYGTSKHLHEVKRLNLRKLVSRKIKNTTCHAVVTYLNMHNASTLFVFSERPIFPGME